MKAVILAAGIGSRLDQTIHHPPKALTKIKTGHSILQWQIDALTRCEDIDQIYVVVGYQKELIMEAFPTLNFLYNPSYQIENTSKSLLRILKKIDQDVLCLNGDVLFNPKILQSLKPSSVSWMMVNLAPVGEEEVKYLEDANGKILAISKEVENGQGEAIGINFFTQKDLPLLISSLEKCLPTDYFEKGIEMSIQKGLSIWTSPIDFNDSVEIDFPKDLERANTLVDHWISLK